MDTAQHVPICFSLHIYGVSGSLHDLSDTTELRGILRCQRTTTSAPQALLPVSLAPVSGVVQGNTPVGLHLLSAFPAFHAMLTLCVLTLGIRATDPAWCRVSPWCPLNFTLFGDGFSFPGAPKNSGRSSLAWNSAAEKPTSLHLSAELNCGTSLEVESPLRQRRDFLAFFFFGRSIGCRNAAAFETASCCGLVHRSCATLRDQEQAGDRGAGVRQCYSAAPVANSVSSVLRRLLLFPQLFDWEKTPSCNNIWVFST